MTLLLFLLGIVAIYAIARYNESNKLFWVLLISFIGSFAIATVVYKTTESKKGRVDDVCFHTQGSNSVSSFNSLADINLFDTIGNNIPEPVGNGITSNKNTFKYEKGLSIDSGDIAELLKPPIRWTTYFDTS